MSAAVWTKKLLEMLIVRFYIEFRAALNVIEREAAFHS